MLWRQKGDGGNAYGRRGQNMYVKYYYKHLIRTAYLLTCSLFADVIFFIAILNIAFFLLSRLAVRLDVEHGCTQNCIRFHKNRD